MIARQAGLIDHADFERVSQILKSADAPRPENLLALTGDKRIFFGPEKAAALAFSDIGRTRVAMGGSIGPRRNWAKTLKDFREEALQAARQPVIYSAAPELLPELTHLGFKAAKIGESAILNLPEFSLSGRKRELVRRSRRKLTERFGASFEIAVPPHSDALMKDLNAISNLWLGANGGREKTFSNGRFEKNFLELCPIGIVRIDGKIIAFASLLTTTDKSWAAVDLMRYDPERAVTNTMDFLLAELIFWTKASDFLKFDLAMAPLSGLMESESASGYARLGTAVFNRGERFYNFQGLRRFKQKFDPVWEPRYVATLRYWSLPILFFQMGVLTQNVSFNVPRSSFFVSRSRQL